MGSDRALGLLNEMLWNTLLIAGPVLLAILAVGLLISVVQVATQIQEITLSYVPKMLVLRSIQRSHPSSGRDAIMRKPDGKSSVST